jgi:3-hydroxybutyryl-CoA dehydrogenase
MWMQSLPRDKAVVVIGAGAMGAGIAQVAAAAGHQVLLYDVRAGAAADAVAGIGAGLGKLVAREKLGADAAKATMGRLTPIDDLKSAAFAGLAIEAIKEDLEIKRALFAELEEILDKDAILATNTSSLSVTAIGAHLRRPDRLAGLHFFNPAPIMPLVEVITGLATDPHVAEVLLATAHAWGKSPVLARSTPGFIVNRVARPYYAEALRLLQEGAADTATLDALLREGFGFRMGPFELMDLIGHDVNFATTCSVHAAYFGDPRFTPSIIQRELVEAGWLGRKSGRGFYDYSSGAVIPKPTTIASETAASTVVIEGDLGPAEPLVARLEAGGMTVARRSGAGRILLGSTVMTLSDGRTATERARQDSSDELVVFDLADWVSGRRIALARALQASDQSLATAAGLFRRAGFEPSEVQDLPGLVCLRTVAMLINEAADTVLHGVASAANVDIAMLKGVNYPVGPLAFADRLGPAFVLQALDNIGRTYGEDRYRASALLRRLATANHAFHSAAPSSTP